MKSRIFLLTLLVSFAAITAMAQTVGADGRNGNTPSTPVMIADPVTPVFPRIFNGSDQDVPTKDNVINDDQVVIGGLGCGVDIFDGYNFQFKPLTVRANNTRIYFDDSSTPGSFPSNDWVLVANSNLSGGDSYFAIMDSTGGTTPFKTMALAPDNSLYIKATSGNIGFGTANPILDLHVLNGNTPGLRLDQDNSQGWGVQVWDIAANESNFFIRDATNGSTLPFRIKPGAPSSSLTIQSTGNVGIGTWAPTEKLDVNGSMKLASGPIPGAPTEGTIYMDSADHFLKYYDGSQWNIVTENTDEQDLTSATLTGTVLQINIENGASASVDLAPMLADIIARIEALEAAVGLKEIGSKKSLLAQNAPNPFISETFITYYIEPDVHTASLAVYDVQGALIKEIPIDTRGDGMLRIGGEEFGLGSYFYALIIDGQKSESRILIKVE